MSASNPRGKPMRPRWWRPCRAKHTSRIRFEYTQPRLLHTTSQDEGEQDAFVLLWQRVTETRSQGWGRNEGKLYIWRKKMERQQRRTLKKRGKEYKSRISKLPLAQGSGLPLKQYNYKVGLKQTKDLVTNFLPAIASKPFLLVAGLDKNRVSHTWYDL